MGVLSLDFFEDLVIFAIIVAVVLIVLIYRSDGDLTLMFYDKYGAPVEDMAGQVVWITGASSGIGAALGVRLAQAGCKLVLSARRLNELESVKKNCLESGTKLKDQDVLVLPMDVTEIDKHNDHFQKVINHFGKLDVLVNNAGRSQRAAWTDIKVDVDKQLFDLNVFGLLGLTRIIVPYFIGQGQGTVAVMSSAAGKIGVPFSASYTGSKHALHGYFESLRNELAGKNLNITMLCPGPVTTDLLQAAFTAEPGKEFGEKWTANEKRMSAERCAQLSAVAIRHGLTEVFMAPNPVLLLMMIYQYFPGTFRSFTTSKFFGSRGSKMWQKLRDQRDTVQAADQKK